MPNLRVDAARLQLRTPLRTTWGDLRERTILSVRLSWQGDDHGVGEAAALEAHDGVSLAAVRAALEAYREVLRRMPADAPHEMMLAACAAERELPQALAAIDLALWDRAGRLAGRPVAELIDARAPRAVPVDATIGAHDPIFAAAEAYRATMAGHRCVRVRVGIGDDEARVMAVRQAVGPRVAIRVDAGGAWQDTIEALANLEPLTGAGIELVEDPVVDPGELRRLRDESPIPVAVDSLEDDWSSKRSDPGIVRLRVSSSGGISGLLSRAREIRRAGVAVYVASNFDGPLGIAAGVHAAAALLAEGPLPASGLSTLGMFHEHAHMLPADNGAIQVPSEPGLLGTTTRVK